MFTAFLRDHPMAELLKSGTRALYPPAEDRQAWAGIAERHRKEIRDLAESFAKVPYPVRSATGFLAFARTGDR